MNSDFALVSARAMRYKCDKMNVCTTVLSFEAEEEEDELIKLEEFGDGDLMEKTAGRRDDFG